MGDPLERPEMFNPNSGGVPIPPYNPQNSLLQNVHIPQPQAPQEPAKPVGITPKEVYASVLQEMGHCQEIIDNYGELVNQANSRIGQLYPLYNELVQYLSNPNQQAVPPMVQAVLDQLNSLSVDFDQPPQQQNQQQHHENPQFLNQMSVPQPQEAPGYQAVESAPMPAPVNVSQRLQANLKRGAVIDNSVHNVPNSIQGMAPIDGVTWEEMQAAGAAIDALNQNNRNASLMSQIPVENNLTRKISGTSLGNFQSIVDMQNNQLNNPSNGPQVIGG